MFLKISKNSQANTCARVSFPKLRVLFRAATNGNIQHAIKQTVFEIYFQLTRSLILHLKWTCLQVFFRLKTFTFQNKWVAASKVNSESTLYNFVVKARRLLFGKSILKVRKSMSDNEKINILVWDLNSVVTNHIVKASKCIQIFAIIQSWRLFKLFSQIYLSPQNIGFALFYF